MVNGIKILKVVVVGKNQKNKEKQLRQWLLTIIPDNMSISSNITTKEKYFPEFLDYSIHNITPTITSAPTPTLTSASTPTLTTAPTPTLTTTSVTTTSVSTVSTTSNTTTITTITTITTTTITTITTTIPTVFNSIENGVIKCNDDLDVCFKDDDWIVGEEWQ